jgi:hypothetical protein
MIAAWQGFVLELKRFSLRISARRTFLKMATRALLLALPDKSPKPYRGQARLSKDTLTWYRL